MVFEEFNDKLLDVFLATLISQWNYVGEKSNFRLKQYILVILRVDTIFLRQIHNRPKQVTKLNLQ